MARMEPPLFMMQVINQERYSSPAASLAVCSVESSKLMAKENKQTTDPRLVAFLSFSLV